MKAFFFIILALICGLFALALIGAHNNPRIGIQADAPHEKTGCSASYRAVEARLKSPASAKRVDCHSVTTNNGVQLITVTMDSQNSYGAMIRSQWVTTVRDNNVESVTQQR